MTYCLSCSYSCFSSFSFSISHSCFMNTSIHVSFLVHIYILYYYVFQLTLTKRLVYLVQQFNFQTRCGHQMPLNSIWLDSRLNELSIESTNTHNGVLTKELCKLQAVTKISNSQHLQQQHQPLSFVIFGDLNFLFDTFSWYYFKAKVLRVLLQLESPKSEHRNSSYVLNNPEYSMFKTRTRNLLEHGPTLSEFLGHLESEFEGTYFMISSSPCSQVLVET